MANDERTGSGHTESTGTAGVASPPPAAGANGAIAAARRPRVSAEEALARLKEGNRRYVQNVRSVDSLMSHSRRADLTTQSPFAIIIGCSDSRAPAEMVFDQGLGDLFVIRVAGNVVAPSQVGSVEFAADRFGTRLVVVMGHSHCGAVDAALETILNRQASTSPNISSIVNRVRSGIESMVTAELRQVRGRSTTGKPTTPAGANAADAGDGPDDLDLPRIRREAVRTNVRAAVDHLLHGSEVIERLALEDGLAVVGAELDLATGEVTFFDADGA